MGIAKGKQSLQDRVTQQWVILTGKKINTEDFSWLLGPFGETDGIGDRFIQDLAKKEGLRIDTVEINKGLIQSINQLNLRKEELSILPLSIVDFYENTSNYHLELRVKWNPFFKIFGVLLRLIFSKRIQQLNVPLQNSKDSDELTNQIIHLKDKKTDEVKRTIWLRKIKSTAQVVYSGVYETCILPSGQACVKAIFPLPNGSATVILTPKVTDKGHLILESSGKEIGDSGFYFLLSDSNDQLWAKFIKSFKDTLILKEVNDGILATQKLTIWGLRLVEFEYKINKK
ncbi:MAG: hypothetical protein KDC84_14695 [Crocinitomicaceae bacterium]|nr:hypothetical protein [Crocinitomicaceae bacterium]